MFFLYANQQSYSIIDSNTKWSEGSTYFLKLLSSICVECGHLCKFGGFHCECGWFRDLFGSVHLVEVMKLPKSSPRKPQKCHRSDLKITAKLIVQVLFMLNVFFVLFSFGNGSGCTYVLMTTFLSTFKPKLAIYFFFCEHLWIRLLEINNYSLRSNS